MKQRTRWDVVCILQDRLPLLASIAKADGHEMLAYLIAAADAELRAEISGKPGQSLPDLLTRAPAVLVRDRGVA